MFQCAEREIPPGPMATYPRWRELGRHVRKGEKAITLCMPITVKRKRAEVVPEPDEPNDVITRFVYKPRWFVLSQTEGDPLPEAEIPSWDRDTALEALDVREIPFEHLDGNCLGFARERSIAISPVNPLPHKTRFHELAHVLLGHTTEGQQADSEITPRTLRDCEAESVALLCCAALDLPGVAECRGYVQHWWGQGHEIPRTVSPTHPESGGSDSEGRDGSGGALMTPLDPRLQAAIDELANALQTATLVAGQVRRDAETLHQAVSRAVTALQSVRKGVQP